MSKYQLIFVLAFSHVVTTVAAAQGLNSRAFDTLPTVAKRPVTGNIGPVCPTLGQQVNSTGAGECNVTLTIKMGKYEPLDLCEPELNARSYTPEALLVGPDEWTDDPEVLYISYGEHVASVYRGSPTRTPILGLRQIKAPDFFVDVVTISQWEYEVRTYHMSEISLRRADTQEGFKRVKGEGSPKPIALYKVSGLPFAVYNLKNPDPSKTDRIRISYVSNATSKVFEVFHDPKTDAWTATDGGGQLVVEKTSVINPEDPCERTEVRVENENGVQVRRRTRVFRGFAWAQELVSESEEERGEIKTTTYTYYQNPREPGYMSVQTKTFPDGSWETYDYPSDARGNVHQRVIASGGSRRQ